MLAAWAKGAKFDKGGARASFRFVGAPKAAMTAVGAFVEHVRANLSQGPKKQYYRDEPAMLSHDARAQALAEWKTLDDEGRRPFQQMAAGKPCCCCSASYHPHHCHQSTPTSHYVEWGAQVRAGLA